MTDETSTTPREGTAAAPEASAAAASEPSPRDGTAAPAGPSAAAPASAVLGLPPPRLLRWEIVAVFAISLGGSGLYALVSYIGTLTARQSVSSQATVLNGTLAPGRPLFGLFLQLLNIALALAPVLMVFYLLARAGEGPADIGLDARHPVQDTVRGAVLAAVIGGSGLALYLAAYHLGVEVNVVAESLPVIWWRIPVLLLSAAQNAAVEEIIVVGYLMSRLDKLGVRPSRAIAISAVIRGSYHLYQGPGAFLGNAVMGAIFAYLYRRWGRITPMFIAHFLIDAVTFVGYALLAGHVGWLPAP
jgi:hypothetical protein